MRVHSAPRIMPLVGIPGHRERQCWYRATHAASGQPAAQASGSLHAVLVDCNLLDAVDRCRNDLTGCSQSLSAVRCRCTLAPQQRGCRTQDGMSHMGGSLQVEGLENMPDDDTPAVYVSNHESYMVCPPCCGTDCILPHVTR